MGRRLGKVKPGQSDKSQGVKRTGAGAEKAIVKPYATAGDQRKRQTVKRRRCRSASPSFGISRK